MSLGRTVVTGDIPDFNRYRSAASCLWSDASPTVPICDCAKALIVGKGNFNHNLGKEMADSAEKTATNRRSAPGFGALS